MPFVFTEILGPDILALSSALDRVGIPEKPDETRKLPIINVPIVQFGAAKLTDLFVPQFEISDEAKNLYNNWGVPTVKVETTGEVKEPSPTGIPGNIPLVSSLSYMNKMFRT